MANENPIHIDEDPKATDFVIPKEYASTQIYLTLKVELVNKDWKYAAAHIIYLRNADLYPQLAPEPEELKIDNAKNLDGKKLKINSHVSKFNPDGKDGAKSPKVNYTLIIEAGDDQLEEFSAKSGTQNPVDFNSIILFKLEK